MVQIVENWADLTGIIREVQPDRRVADHLALGIEVIAVTPVAGFPNLFADAVGTTIPITVRATTGVTANLPIGGTIHCRVRKTGPGRGFADPDHLQVTPPDRP
jgi:hypothetical protein